MSTRILLLVKTAGGDNLPRSSAEVMAPGNLNLPESFRPHRPVLRFFTYIYILLNYSLEQRPFDKLTGLQQVKKFPALYGTLSYITAFTGARHLFIS
jgi:hypothetical protein